MATDLDTLLLQIKVDNKQLNTGINQAETKIDKFSKNTSKAFATIAAAATAAFALRGVVDTITNFEKLEASLRTVTGSADAAARELAKLQNFAATTPFQLTEVVDAFIKMKALGLDPSEEALNSFGNTATAMGKSLNQFIEAVADAATGEFERLKEFGIRAKQQGDNVTFIFQGVETTIEKSADAIQGYLQNIGDVQFAGAMAEQADTLNVAISNLGDSFDKLVKQIGDSGLTQALVSITNTLREQVDLFRRVREDAYEYGKSLGTTGNDLELFAMQAQAAADAIKAQSLAKQEALNAVNEEANQKELEEQQVHQEAVLASMQEHLEKLVEVRKGKLSEIEKFNELSYKAQAKTVFGELQNITDGVAQHNRALFEANKIAGIANAVINAYEGISKTMAAYPFPINVGLAAAHATAAFAQVNAIRSTSFGGGGGAAPSLSGSTAAAPVSDVGGGGSDRGVNISIAGVDSNASFTGSQVRELIGAINDEIDNGAIIKGVNIS